MCVCVCVCVCVAKSWTLESVFSLQTKIKKSNRGVQDILVHARHVSQDMKKHINLPIVLKVINEFNLKSGMDIQ